MFEYFDWIEKGKKLNSNVIEARNPENRDNTMCLINEFGGEATRLSGNEIGLMKARERESAAYACAHAAWIFIVDRQEQKAQYLLSLASKFVMSEDAQILGYIEYVRSTVERGQSNFQAAVEAGLRATEYFSQVSKEDNAFIIAHANMQTGLAYLRLNSHEKAIKLYEEARTAVEIEENTSSLDRAICFIKASEGSIEGRCLKNLAQIYIKNGQYHEALGCFSAEVTSPCTSLDIGYRKFVQAEAHIGLKNYFAANKLLEEADDLYVAEKSEYSPNYLRILLGHLEVNQGCGEPLSRLEEAIELHSQVIGNNPEHALTIRLNNVRHAALAMSVDLEQTPASCCILM